MKMKDRFRFIKLFLILFLFSLTSLSFAGESMVNSVNAPQVFNEANKAYRSGRYQDAAKLFETIIAAKQLSASVYFNLGNCYYKTQDFPNAVLNFERARRMDPVDDDIQYNLKLAYSNTVDKIEPVPQLFYQHWWEVLLNFMTPSGWSWLGVVLIWISVIIGVLYLYADTISKRKLSFLSGSGIFILACFILFIAMSANSRLNNDKGAVVMETSAYVKSSPDQKSTNLFMLHAGTRIEVVDEISGWKQIKIANGNIGWIDAKSIELI